MSAFDNDHEREMADPEYAAAYRATLGGLRNLAALREEIEGFRASFVRRYTRALVRGTGDGAPEQVAGWRADALDIWTAQHPAMRDLLTPASEGAHVPGVTGDRCPGCTPGRLPAWFDAALGGAWAERDALRVALAEAIGLIDDGEPIQARRVALAALRGSPDA